MKTENINARILPEEKETLECIANTERLNLSESIRLVIREAAKARGLWPPQQAHGQTQVE